MFFKFVVLFLSFICSTSWASENLIISNQGIIVVSNKSIDSSYIIEGHITNNHIITMTDSRYSIQKNTNHNNNFSFISTLPKIDTISSDNLLFNFNSSGISSPLTGSFHYRLAGQLNFNKVIATQSDSLWSFNIPEEAITIRGLEYYIELKSPTKRIYQGHNNNPLRFITSFSSNIGKADIEITPNKYSLIGFPVSVSDSSTSVFFSNIFGEYDPLRWRLGHYSTNLKKYIEYPNLPPLMPGIGLWIISDRKKEISTEGYSVIPNRIVEDKNYYEIKLDSGWNQIANPFAFDIDWEMILFEPSALISDSLPIIEPVGYLFNGNNFFPASVVPAWSGLFIFSYQNVSILFPSEEINSHQSQKVTLSNPENIINIELITKKYSDPDNFIGFSKNGKDGLDRMDRHKPPLPSELPFLYFQTNGEKLSQDIRKSENDLYQFEFHLKIPDDSYLKFTGLNSLEKDNLIMLLKFDHQTIFLLHDSTISINKNIDNGIIYIGQKDKIEQQLSTIPEEFNLSQNYPNPFNNSTSISFSLPYQSVVRIEIFNSLGRKVKTLSNSEFEPGTHTIIWDGFNSKNNKAASGIYFTRLTTPQFEKSIKMLLIK